MTRFKPTEQHWSFKRPMKTINHRTSAVMWQFTTNQVQQSRRSFTRKPTWQAREISPPGRLPLPKRHRNSCLKDINQSFHRHLEFGDPGRPPYLVHLPFVSADDHLHERLPDAPTTQQHQIHGAPLLTSFLRHRPTASFYLTKKIPTMTVLSRQALKYMSDRLATRPCRASQLPTSIRQHRTSVKMGFSRLRVLSLEDEDKTRLGGSGNWLRVTFPLWGYVLYVLRPPTITLFTIS